MKRNFSDYIVALAVIACSLVLLGALTIALSGYRLKKPARTLQIDYEDVTGIKLHSEVRYAGAPAGRVIAMRNLNATVIDLKSDLGEFMPKLPPLFDTAKADLDELQKVVTGLNDVETQVGTVLGTANSFLGTTDKQLQEQLAQLHVTLLNLKVI